MAVLGTPSSSCSRRIFFSAMVAPLVRSRALYTTPYVPSPIFSTFSYCAPPSQAPVRPPLSSSQCPRRCSPPVHTARGRAQAPLRPPPSSSQCPCQSSPPSHTARPLCRAPLGPSVQQSVPSPIFSTFILRAAGPRLSTYTSPSVQQSVHGVGGFVCIHSRRTPQHHCAIQQAEVCLLTQRMLVSLRLCGTHSKVRVPACWHQA